MTSSPRASAADLDEAPLRTFDKGLTVLEGLADIGRQGATTAELGRRLGLHRTTVHRFLQTLARRGYAEQIANSDRYRVGLKVLGLASSTMAGLSFRDVGMPVLETLSAETHETVHLVMLDQGEVVTVDRIEAEHPIALRTYIGARRPAYCSAAGKAMLAYLPLPEVDRILARGMPARTPKTITDPHRFKAQLWEVTQCGYALDDEENLEDVRCAAAPVFNLDGRLAGGVSLLAPAMRVNDIRLQELAEAVLAAARELSRRLGYQER
ncbi:MAG: IclR family transcriptional regulator [Chloroflexi bacterium]|nr:IclR family transcriptional regulator [Chloroflexota bacterium]